MAGIAVLAFLALFFGPAIVAGAVGFGSSSARAGIAVAAVIIMGIVWWATGPGQNSELEGPGLFLLTLIVLLPSFALAATGAFTGAALRRSRAGRPGA